MENEYVAVLNNMSFNPCRFLNRLLNSCLNKWVFDTIPIEKIQDAETALLKTNEKFPAEILKRLFSDKELSDSDHEAILNIADNILAPFQDKPEEKEKQTVMDTLESLGEKLMGQKTLNLL